METLSAASILIASLVALSVPVWGGSLCDDLESSIRDYFVGNQYQFVLHRLMGIPMDALTARTKAFHGRFDIQDSQQRRRFACSLAAAHSHNQLSSELDATFGDTPPTFTEIITMPIIDHRNSIGSVDRLVELAHVYVVLLRWAQRSGYPVLPLSSNRTDNLNTFGVVWRALSKHYIHRFLDKQLVPFPIHMTPYQATSLLEGAESYSELDEELELPPNTMSGWAEIVKGYPRVMGGMAEDIERFMHFIQALDNTALLIPS